METIVECRNGIPHFVNEFWTSKQRQCHSIHEISYRACFKPQLPNFFISRLTNPGEIVHDPFMGRGTTPIEAALMRRVPCGNDINPLSIAMAAPRIRTPNLSQIWSRLSELPWDEGKPVENEKLLAFYHCKTLAKIEMLRDWLLEREAAGRLDDVDAWIRMVAINRLTGHSTGFFSVYTLPPNQAVSVDRQTRINKRRSQVPPARDVPGLIWKKSKALLVDGDVHSERAMFFTGPAHKTSGIGDCTVGLTVTSPPFLDIVAYETDNWLRCWFAGIDPDAVAISKHRYVPEWQEFVRLTLTELGRITRPGGHIAFEVGEVRNGSVKLEENVIAAASGLPLQVMGVIINQQNFTKTSNCWGVSNNERGTNTNRIVLIRKV
ncbi:MAG: site-specific DNA-methyltransferase [Rhodobacteraceae bacterium]|nr:site-specific DNA-methyltransferase [Paracoccaceae bacterium]